MTTAVMAAVNAAADEDEQRAEEQSHGVSGVRTAGDPALTAGPPDGSELLDQWCSQGL